MGPLYPGNQGRAMISVSWKALIQGRLQDGLLIEQDHAVFEDLGRLGFAGLVVGDGSIKRALDAGEGELIDDTLTGELVDYSQRCLHLALVLLKDIQPRRLDSCVWRVASLS